jgi:hypothetical protein
VPHKTNVRHFLRLETLSVAACLPIPCRQCPLILGRLHVRLGFVAFSTFLNSLYILLARQFCTLSSVPGVVGGLGRDFDVPFSSKPLDDAPSFPLLETPVVDLELHPQIYYIPRRIINSIAETHVAGTTRKNGGQSPHHILGVGAPLCHRWSSPHRLLDRDAEPKRTVARSRSCCNESIA